MRLQSSRIRLLFNQADLTSVALHIPVRVQRCKRVRRRGFPKVRSPIAVLYLVCKRNASASLIANVECSSII